MHVHITEFFGREEFMSTLSVCANQCISPASARAKALQKLAEGCLRLSRHYQNDTDMSFHSFRDHLAGWNGSQPQLHTTTRPRPCLLQRSVSGAHGSAHEDGKEVCRDKRSSFQQIHPVHQSAGIILTDRQTAR